MALAAKSPAARLAWCARVAAVLALWHASTVVHGGVTAAAAAGTTELARIPVEFWHHAVLTAGVWFTLSASLPDYARRAANHRGRAGQGVSGRVVDEVLHFMSVYDVTRRRE